MSPEEIFQIQHERYTAFKTGKCAVCANVSVDPGEALCPECRKKRTEYIQSQEEKRLQELAERQKRKRRLRREQGLCRCGRPRKLGYMVCEKCYSYRKRSPIPRSERKAYGLCCICGVEVDNDGDSLCKSCKERASQNIKNLNANPTPSMIENRERYKAYNNTFYRSKR